MVYLFNVTAEVFRPTATSQTNSRSSDGAVRKDSAVHVSLSSIQFSNSPEPKRHIHPELPPLKPPNPPDDDLQPTTGRLPIHSSR